MFLLTCSLALGSSHLLSFLTSPQLQAHSYACIQVALQNHRHFVPTVFSMGVGYERLELRGCAPLYELAHSLEFASRVRAHSWLPDLVGCFSCFWRSQVVFLFFGGHGFRSGI